MNLAANFRYGVRTRKRQIVNYLRIGLAAPRLWRRGLSLILQVVSNKREIRCRLDKNRFTYQVRIHEHVAETDYSRKGHIKAGS